MKIFNFSIILLKLVGSKSQVESPLNTQRISDSLDTANSQSGNYYLKSIGKIL